MNAVCAALNVLFFPKDAVPAFSAGLTPYLIMLPRITGPRASESNRAIPVPYLKAVVGSTKSSPPLVLISSCATPTLKTSEGRKAAAILPAVFLLSSFVSNFFPILGTQRCAVLAPKTAAGIICNK